MSPRVYIRSLPPEGAPQLVAVVGVLQRAGEHLHQGARELRRMDACVDRAQVGVAGDAVRKLKAASQD